MSIEQYQLKIGVFCQDNLNINDLLEFLQVQINQYLVNTTKKFSSSSKSNEKFISTFQKIPKSEIQQQQYVGFLFIYNSSEFETVQYIKRILEELGFKGTQQTFLTLVELQTKEKINLTQEQGRILSEKYQGDFIKLGIQNAQDLVNNIIKYLNTMIQNYYLPSELIMQQIYESPQSHFEQKEYQLNYIRKSDHQQIDKNIENQVLNEQAQSLGFLETTSRIRQERLKILDLKQQEIDTNIKNLQRVLENMDVHINSKFETDWYTNLKNSIYSKVEKQSVRHSKIKLTQHFLEPNNQLNKTAGKIPFETTIIRRMKNPILKIQLVFANSTIIVSVYEDSTYDQLSQTALCKIGLKLSQHNMSEMKKKIKNSIINFVEQLNRMIITIQNEKLANRTYIK